MVHFNPKVRALKWQMRVCPSAEQKRFPTGPEPAAAVFVTVSLWGFSNKK